MKPPPRRENDMRINCESGFTFNEAKENVISEIIYRYGVNRKYALKLFAEAIIRNCVQDELFGEIDWLIGKEEEA